MTLQNRVQPDQSIQALPSRGLLTGNRGILHDETRTLRRPWAAKAWICCRLDWKGTRRIPMAGRSWTELFFLDEAVALAAGHRPCALCRREAHQAFRTAWTDAGLPGARAPEIDAHLHAHRLRARHPHHPLTDPGPLPDFTFVAAGTPLLLIGPQAFPYTPQGYLAPIARPTHPLPLLTPLPTVATLAAGYRPLLHPSAK